MEVRQHAVDGVGARRAGRATGLVARAEHEVVDEELGATFEELRERPRALVGLEPVLLLDGDPGQLATLARELVAHRVCSFSRCNSSSRAACHSSRLPIL